MPMIGRRPLVSISGAIQGSQGGDVGAGDPAVDHELRRRDEAGLVTGQEQYRAGYLIGLGEAAGRDVDEASCGPLRIRGEQLLEQWGVDPVSYTHLRAHE